MLRLRLRMARPWFAWDYARRGHGAKLLGNHAYSIPDWNCAEFGSTDCDQRRAKSGRQFSTLIFASWMTGPHLSISDFRKAASSAGVEPFGVAPRSSNRCLTDGWTNAALVSALILAMTSCGVLAGTKK